MCANILHYLAIFLTCLQYEDRAERPRICAAFQSTAGLHLDSPNFAESQRPGRDQTESHLPASYAELCSRFFLFFRSLLDLEACSYVYEREYHTQPAHRRCESVCAVCHAQRACKVNSVAAPRNKR